MKKIKNKILAMLPAISFGLLSASCTFQDNSAETLKQKEIEKQRKQLNEEINNISVSLKNDVNKENVFPSEIDLSNFEISNKKDNFIFRTDGPLVSDDINGTLTLNYYFEILFIDEEKGINEWISSKKISKTFEDFKSYRNIIDKEAEKIVLSIREDNKQTTLPSDFIKITNNFIFEEVSQDFSLQYNFEFNDELGNVIVNYFLQDTEKNLSSKIIKKQFDGFYTSIQKAKDKENQRLNYLLDTINLEDKVTSSKDKVKPSLIVKENFATEIENAKLVIENLVANDDDGSLTLSYFIQSTKQGLSELVSSKKEITIENFLTRDVFDQRRKQTITNELNSKITTLNVSVEDKNVETKASRSPKNVTEQDLNFTFEDENISIKVKNLIFDEVKGEIIVEFVFYKHDIDLDQDVFSTQSARKVVNGYKTKELIESEERQRLNDLLKNINDISLISKNVNESFASEIIKEDFDLNSLPNTKIEIINLVLANDEQGTINIEFILKSLINENGNIISEKKTIVKNGFLTKNQYLDNLKQTYNQKVLNNEIGLNVSFKKESEKANILPSSVVKEDFEISVNNENGLAIKEYTLLAKDVEGTLELNINFLIHDNKFNQDIELSETKKIVYTEFLTQANSHKRAEIERLNNLLNFDNLVILKNESDKTEKSAFDITKEDFQFNSEKQEELVDVKLEITQLTPNDNGELIIDFAISKETEEYGKASSNTKQLRIQFLSKDDKSIKDANKLEIPTEANYMPENVYVKDDMTPYFTNTEELAKILGLSDFVTNNPNLEIVITKFSFDDGWWTDLCKLKYDFTFRSKTNNSLVSKRFSGKILIADFMKKRNLQNYVENCFEFVVKSKKSAEISQKESSFITKENLLTYFENLKQKDITKKYILDTVPEMMKITNFEIISHDSDAGTATVRVSATYDSVTKHKDYIISGFATKEKLEEIRQNRQNEQERIDALLETLTMTYNKENQKTQLVSDVNLKDFIFNIENQNVIILESKDRVIDGKNGTIMFSIKLRSNKENFNDIVSTKEKVFTLTGFAKDKTEQINSLLEKFKVSENYLNYKEEIENKLNADIEDEAKERNPQIKDNVISVLKQEYTKLTIAVEEAFFESIQTLMSIFMQFNENEQLNEKFFEILGNMFTKTNNELFLTLLEPAVNTNTGKMKTDYQQIVANWIIPNTVGKWATAIFTELNKGIPEFNKYIESEMDKLNTQHEFLNNSEEKQNQTKEVVQNQLKTILDYYKDIKWDYLFLGKGQKQPNYDNYNGGKKLLLLGMISFLNWVTPGWEVLFNTDKFINANVYKDSDDNNLITNLNKLVTDNKITEDEKNILFKESKTILSPFLKAIDIYNKKIKKALEENLYNNFVNIVNETKK
ncbi:lipoprotein 17-related variable surface protein [Mycoplasmopsis arginini]|uniref:lipoprotein 17-related variable surface protein n=1 Tax=Mycoplasmopsis arginini TaxID=2094 RepID=UPI003CFCFB34